MYPATQPTAFTQSKTTASILTDSYVTDSQLTDCQLTDCQLTDHQLTDRQLTDCQRTDRQSTANAYSNVTNSIHQYDLQSTVSFNLLAIRVQRTSTAML